MKLISKLTLFITLSKLVMVLLFVFMLPYLVERIAFQYTNSYLKEQRKKVLSVIKANGIDYYLQGLNEYGSYTMLKEEYISLEPVASLSYPDTIETAERLVENDTLTYRILSHNFKIDNQTYLLEVGKTITTINQYNRPLQKIALYVLISLIVVSLLIDLIFTRFLLKPLGRIIKTKLINQKFPFRDDTSPIKTSTIDFKYLDTSLIQLMEQINIAFEKEREFTANASHELMTPVSILQSKIENLMLHEEISEEVHHRLIEMMKTLNRLKKIVNSLLLISRIENEQFAKTDTVAVKEFVEEVIEEIEHRLEEKQISLTLKLSETVLIKNINRDLIFQMTYNLVNNAIKYNKEFGTIIIEDELIPEKEYKIRIVDTGIGIPNSALGAIFDRFKKTDLSEEEGYGLGLAIVKSIAAYHNIELKVNSTVNEGTTFSVVFPEIKLGND